MNSSEIRQSFLYFFKARGHEIVRDAPVVPQGDPTLLFTNAGMNQFKDVFLGTGHAALQARRRHAEVHPRRRQALGPRGRGLRRLPPLVLRDARELVLRRLLQGGVARVGLGAPRRRSGSSTRTSSTRRFTAGPVGSRRTRKLSRSGRRSRVFPTSEFFVSRRRTTSGRWATPGPAARAPRSTLTAARAPATCSTFPNHKCGVNAGCSRFMEIWNHVFIQYNKQADGTLAPLPAKHVDTGMGFERVTAIIQGKKSNYETDIFMPIIQAIEERTKVKYDAARLGRSRPPRDRRPRAHRSASRSPTGLSPGTPTEATCCAGSSGAPRASSTSSGVKEPAIKDIVPTLVDAHGLSVPRDRRAPGPRRARDRAGGEGVPPDARPRRRPLRQGRQGPERARHEGDRREHGVPALRHLRLPVRPDRADGHGGAASRSTAKASSGSAPRRRPRTAPRARRRCAPTPPSSRASPARPLHRLREPRRSAASSSSRRPTPR